MSVASPWRREADAQPRFARGSSHHKRAARHGQGVLTSRSFGGPGHLRSGSTFVCRPPHRDTCRTKGGPEVGLRWVKIGVRPAASRAGAVPSSLTVTVLLSFASCVLPPGEIRWRRRTSPFRSSGTRLYDECSGHVGPTGPNRCLVRSLLEVAGIRTMTLHRLFSRSKEYAHGQAEGRRRQSRP